MKWGEAEVQEDLQLLSSLVPLTAPPPSHKWIFIKNLPLPEHWARGEADFGGVKVALNCSWVPLECK